jgi:hypothetical protein
LADLGLQLALMALSIASSSLATVSPPRPKRSFRHSPRPGGTPATVLCDGDAGLWRLQRETLPAATVVLDWWHVAIRFGHALQTARGLGAGAADADLSDEAVCCLERANGACGTAGGPGAGVNWLAYIAGRSASRCAR